MKGCLGVRTTAAAAVLLLLVVAFAGALAHAQAEVGGASFVPPRPSTSDYVLFENFDRSWQSRWVVSEAVPGTWKVAGTHHELFDGAPGDRGLILQDAGKRSAISARFNSILADNAGKDLFVQYEVRLMKGLDCGGAYIKLLSHDPAAPFTPERQRAEFGGDTPYTIMFGPDKCAATTRKVHCIIRRENPSSHEWEEKHVAHAPTPYIDRNTHLYRLEIRANGTWAMFTDEKLERNGTFHGEGPRGPFFAPAFGSPAIIDDPADIKPADWADAELMDDPDDVQPDDWVSDASLKFVRDTDAPMPDSWLEHEPLQVPDPDAQQPLAWDEDEDGEWEAPLVPNPACAGNDVAGCGPYIAPLVRNPLYKGPWSPRQILNPAYKGEWKAAQIENPHAYEDPHPEALSAMWGVGIELWTMTPEIQFDNILVTHNRAHVEEMSAHWRAKLTAEKEQAKADREAREGGTTLTAVLGSMLGDNPQLVYVGAAVIVLFVLIFMLIRGAPQSNAAHKKTDDGGGGGNVDTDSGSDSDDNEEIVIKAATMRKRKGKKKSN